MSKLIFSSVLLSLFVSLSAHAFPLPKANIFNLPIPQNFTSDYNFEGIVALSNCSGSIVQFEGTPDSDKALVLTNGHCFEGGFAQPGSYVYGRPSSRTFTVLNSTAGSLGKIHATLVIYSTMTRTDITLYKLSETYTDIQSKFGIRPLILSSQHPQIADSMEVVSGYWRRGYACQVEAFIPQLKEDKWTMMDSIRYSRPGCETIGGTSGSPIIKSGTRTVIGINNTGNEDGQKCTMNNPCEIDNEGNINFAKGYSYGQETYIIYSCLNAQKEVDLTIPGCLLPH